LSTTSLEAIHRGSANRHRDEIIGAITEAGIRLVIPAAGQELGACHRR
jgi:hypothetical protein